MGTIVSAQAVFVLCTKLCPEFLQRFEGLIGDEDRATRETLQSRFVDRLSLDAIGKARNLSRERIRQVITDFLRRQIGIHIQETPGRNPSESVAMSYVLGAYKKFGLKVLHTHTIKDFALSQGWQSISVKPQNTITSIIKKHPELFRKTPKSFSIWEYVGPWPIKDGERATPAKGA